MTVENPLNRVADRDIGRGMDGETAAPAPMARGGAIWLVRGALVAVLALFLIAGGLWYHYGTAVFFEVIAAGIAACF